MSSEFDRVRSTLRIPACGMSTDKRAGDVKALMLAAVTMRIYGESDLAQQVESAALRINDS